MAESNVTPSPDGPEIQNDFDLLNEDLPEESASETPEEEAEETEEALEEEPEIEEPTEEPEEEKEEEPEEEKPKAEEKPEEEPKTLHAKLKKIAPDLLKKMPELRQVIFREEKFTQSFPTPEDAKDAAERLEYLGPIEQSLLAGQAGTLLESLANTEGEVIEKVALDFLPELHKRNPQAFFKAVDPVLKRMLNAAATDGQSRDDKNLVAAARWISKFLYGSFDIPALEQAPTKPDPERAKLEQEKKEFAQQRFQVAHADVLQTSVGEVIVQVGKQIDPEGKMTPFMKDTLTEKVMEKIDGALRSDQRHMNAINSLWRRAIKANFTPEWKSRIRSAYLLRARQELPGAIAKVRKEAGLSPIAARQRPPTPARPMPAAGRPAVQNSNGPIPPGRVDYSKTSDMDIIAGRFTPKR